MAITSPKTENRSVSSHDRLPSPERATRRSSSSNMASRITSSLAMSMGSACHRSRAFARETWRPSSSRGMVLLQELGEQGNSEVHLAPPRAPDQTLLNQRLPVHGDTSLVSGTEGAGDFAYWVRTFPERGHGREVPLFGVGCHLEAGAKEIAGQAVLHNLAGAVEVGECDRRGLGEVPELTAVLLNEIRKACGFVHDLAGGFLVVVRAGGRRRGK